MALKAAQCPNCGGELQLPENKNEVTCMYCDTSIIVNEAIGKKTQAMSGTIGTWLELARTAKEAGNDSEAIEYFNKILEVDTSNAEAWFGKGYCIYNTSTLANIKLNEAVTYFKNAVKHASDKKEMQVKIAEALNEFAYNLYSTAINHYNEFIETDDALNDLVIQCSYSLDALELATKYDNQKLYVENALLIFKGGQGKHLNKATEYQTYFQNKMKELNPEWEPEREYPKTGCFIATAAMGSYDHPKVMELRGFRDDWILAKSWGESFVNWYYHYGAKAAKIIDESALLKKVCYLIIVQPLVYISRIIKISKK
ncbi:tetratricopeptide repeat protein [Algibacter sp.]|nr:tetratricopeptide repeat protein [Algibacter sp.]